MKKRIRNIALCVGVASATLSYSVNVSADITEDIENFGKNPSQWFAGKFVKWVNSFEDELKEELEKGIFEGMWEKIGESIGKQIGNSIGSSLTSMFSLGPLVNLGSIVSVNQPSEAQALTQIILEALAKVEQNILASIEAQYVDEVLDDINALKHNYADHNARVDHKLRLTDGDVIEISYMPAAIDIVGAFEGSIQNKIENLHNYFLVNSLWIQMLYEDVQYDFVEAYGGALYNLNQSEIVGLLNNPDNKALMNEDYKLRLQQRILSIDNYLRSLTLEQWKTSNSRMYNKSTIQRSVSRTLYSFSGPNELTCSGFGIRRKCTSPWTDFRRKVSAAIGSYILKPCDGIHSPAYPNVSVKSGSWWYEVNGERVFNKYYYVVCSDEDGYSKNGLHILDHQGKHDSVTKGFNKMLPPSFARHAEAAFARDISFNLPLMVIAGYSPVQEMLDNWWTQAGFNYDRPQNALDTFMHSYDIDRDGFTNGEELSYGTNPNMKDSDGDGRSDYEEVALDGTDPLSSDARNG